jgi:DnaJ-class molecular chaperone
MKDYYSILGVGKSATSDEIKSSYRKLAKELHPDLNPGNKHAEAKFKDVAEGYEILGDPEKRKKYDRGELDEQQQEAYREQQQSRTRKRGYSQSQGPGGQRGYSGRFSFEDIFGGMGGGEGFGGGNFSFAGQDENYTMEVDLPSVAHGAEREIGLPNGKRLRVKIPAGVNDGMRLRFAGQGGPGANGGPPGDVYVEIKVKPSKLYERHGSDLEIEVPISLGEAISGGEVKVPTLDGPVMLKVPAGVSSGAKLRVRGKGLPTREKPGQRGDQLVRLKVVMPPQVDDELKRAVEEWSKKNPYDPRAELDAHEEVRHAG